MAAFGEEAVFQVARRIERPEARRLYLDQVCGPDAGLRDRVDALLRAHDEEGSFLERPAVPAPGPETVTFSPAAGAPSGAYEGPQLEAGSVVTGRYKLLERIG